MCGVGRRGAAPETREIGRCPWCLPAGDLPAAAPKQRAVAALRRRGYQAAISRSADSRHVVTISDIMSSRITTWSQTCRSDTFVITRHFCVNLPDASCVFRVRRAGRRAVSETGRVGARLGPAVNGQDLSFVIHRSLVTPKTVQRCRLTQLNHIQ